MEEKLDAITSTSDSSFADVNSINNKTQEIKKITDEEMEQLSLSSTITSKLDIEIENNSDSQLEPGEVKDDDDSGEASSINCTTTTKLIKSEELNSSLRINNDDKFNSFHNKLNLTSRDSNHSNCNNNSSFIIQPVLSREIVRRRLKALGNFKKIQMESKNYNNTTATIQMKNKKYAENHNIKQCSSNSNNSSNTTCNNKKEKPPTPQEKAELTKQEIEKMKRHEDRAIPYLYYDYTLIHRIRADSPKDDQSTSSSTTLKKSSEFNMKTSSLEAIKNYDNDDDQNGGGGSGCDKFRSNKTPSSASVSSSPSSVSKTKSYKRDEMIRFNKSSLTNKNKSAYNSTFRRKYHPNQQQSTDFIPRRLNHYYNKDNNNFYHYNHSNYNHHHHNRRFQNRFNNIMVTPHEKFNNKFKLRKKDKSYTTYYKESNNRNEILTTNTKTQIMYTKTKPTISYAFNPNIVMDKKSLHFRHPSSPSSSAINDNNDKSISDENNCKNKCNEGNYYDLNPENENNYYKKKVEDKERKFQKNESDKKFRKSSSRSSSVSLKKPKKEQKNKLVKNEVKPSFEGNEDDEDDDEDENRDKDKNEIKKDPILDDDETTLFEVEEDILTFPLSKDETITTDVTIAAATAINDNNDLKDTIIQRKFLSPSLSANIKPNPKDFMSSNDTLLSSSSAVSKIVVDNKSPDTDDYMANWEEDEETVNSCSGGGEATTKILKVLTKNQFNEIKSSIKSSNYDDTTEYDTGILTDSNTATTITINKVNIDEKENSGNTKEDSEIKDGLGTPIFVNPSPPSESLLKNDEHYQVSRTAINANESTEINEDSTKNLMSEKFSKNTPKISNANTSSISTDTTNKNQDYSNTDRNNTLNSSPPTTVKSTSSHLFGMQHIYEQFIQSVSEAGIDLSSNGNHTATISSIKSESVNENATSDLNLNENGEKTPKSEICNYQFSPTRTPPLILPSRRRSSTSSTSSSDSTSSSSSSSSSSSTSSNNSSSSSSSTSSTSSSSVTPSTTSSRFDKTILNDENQDERIAMNTDKIKEIPSRKVDNDGNEIQKRDKINLSSEDKKRIRALQKRRKMLKNLQKQSEEMDDEDKQCLLGVTKLIEAEQTLLMRKFNLTTLENLLIQESSEEEDEDNENDDEKKDPSDDKEKHTRNDETIKIAACVNKTSEERVNVFDKILSGNRETIKLKIPLKVSQRTPIKLQTKTDMEMSDHYSDVEDQDFTEKLMKFSSRSRDKRSSTPQRDSSESRRLKSRHQSDSHSRSSSPRNRRSSNYRARSLSVSPVRHRRSPVLDKRGGRRSHWKKRIYYSPSPKRFRKHSPSDYRRNAHRRSRERTRYYSPPSRKRSPRSPYKYRQSSHSPPHFRPPSPTTTPPQNSRESSRERSKSPYSSDDTVLYKGTNIVNWETIESLPPEYYINSLDNYYYLTPQDEAINDDRDKLGRSYANSYQNYAQYNAYTNNYMLNTESEYHFNYGNEYISTYSKIPVIESNANAEEGEYYYGNMGTLQPFVTVENSIGFQNVSSDSSISMTSADETGKSSTVVVQKGNVLEIVPASVVPTSVDSEQGTTNNSENKSTSVVNAISVNKTSPYNKKKKKKRSSWEDEVAKRHIMSAVLRLNKETDGVIRGILCNKISADVQLKEKKRVLFADGIPPGKSSSGSEDEELSHTKKRKKKKRQSVEENKENENATDVVVEMKIDPALENAPPPPPPPGSPPQHLPQPVLLNPPRSEFIYFHYDRVVNSMYVSLIPTPIPPRLLNRNLRLNTPINASSKAYPFSSIFHGNNPPVTTTTTIKAVKTTLNEINIKGQHSTTVSKAGQNSAREPNAALATSGGGVSTFDQNKSLTSTISSNCLNHIPVETTANNHQQNSVQQFSPPINNLPSQSARMVHMAGQQRVPSPILRHLSNGQIPYRPSLRNSPRLIRPNLIVPPPNISRSNLLSLTPGPPQPIRYFPYPRPPALQSSLSPHIYTGPPPTFHNQVAGVRSNSPQSFCDDGSPLHARNSPPFFGKAIPSIVGKVITSQNQSPVVSYNGSTGPSLSQPRQILIGCGPRSYRNYIPRPQSPLALSQFSNSPFNQSPRIPPQSSTPPIPNHFVYQQQQRPCIRPVPIVRALSVSPTISNIPVVPLSKEGPNINKTIITVTTATTTDTAVNTTTTTCTITTTTTTTTTTAATVHIATATVTANSTITTIATDSSCLSTNLPKAETTEIDSQTKNKNESTIPLILDKSATIVASPLVKESSNDELPKSDTTKQTM